MTCVSNRYFQYRRSLFIRSLLERSVSQFFRAPRTADHLIKGGSSLLIAGVIVPARDPDLDLGERVDLGRDVLEALIYFLDEAVAYPSRKFGIIGAVGTTSISSYAGGGP